MHANGPAPWSTMQALRRQGPGNVLGSCKSNVQDATPGWDPSSFPVSPSPRPRALRPQCSRWPPLPKPHAGVTQPHQAKTSLSQDAAPKCSPQMPMPKANLLFALFKGTSSHRLDPLAIGQRCPSPPVNASRWHAQGPSSETNTVSSCSLRPAKSNCSPQLHPQPSRIPRSIDTTSATTAPSSRPEPSLLQALCATHSRGSVCCSVAAHLALHPSSLPPASPRQAAA